MTTTTQDRKEEPATFEKVWEMFRETDRLIKEMAQERVEKSREADLRHKEMQEDVARRQKEIQEEAARRHKEMQEESARRQKEMQEAAARRQEAAARRQEEAARWQKEMQEEAARRQEEVGRQQKEAARTMEELKQTVRNVSQQLGGMANSDGDAAEELFATSLESKMMFAGQHYDFIDFKVKRKGGNRRGEFDIVLYNGTAVAIVEVKSKACQADVEKLVTKKLPDFRALFPQYKDHDIYLGIGSMSFDDRVRSKAHELGIGILRQKGDTIEADTGHVRAY